MRIYPGKKKSYIILPTILNTLDDDTYTQLSPSNIYAQHFKTIRYIIDILCNSDSNPFYNKNKGSLKKKYYKPSKDKTIHHTEIVNDDLSKYYDMQTKTGRTGNILLERMKDMVHDHKIISIPAYSYFIHSHKMSAYQYPHICFDKWVCWGDLFNKTICSYDAAKQFITDLKRKNIHMYSSRDWYRYYDKIVTHAIETQTICNNEILNIPYYPKLYGNIFSWDDFLGIQSNQRLNNGKHQSHYQSNPIKYLSNNGTIHNKNDVFQKINAELFNMKLLDKWIKVNFKISYKLFCCIIRTYCFVK